MPWNGSRAYSTARAAAIEVIDPGTDEFLKYLLLSLMDFLVQGLSGEICVNAGVLAECSGRTRIVLKRVEERALQLLPRLD